MPARIRDLAFNAARRLGLRGGVLAGSAALIVVATLLVSSTVSDHLAQTATNEAVRTTAAVIHGYVDPIASNGSLTGLSAAERASISAQLERLVASRQILRIKLWSPDGTVIASDLPALEGRHFEPSDELKEALDGENASEYSTASQPENVFERGLADRFLEIYLPVENAAGKVVGAYEIYEDAAPIESQIAATGREVLLITGGMAVGLLALLWFAFGGVTRLLGQQNRLLRDQAAHEQVLMSEVRRSEERFRALVQNSADIVMVLDETAAILYESPAVGRVLGYRGGERRAHSLAELAHPDDAAVAGQLIANVSASPGSQATATFRVRHADGSWRSVEAVATNLMAQPAVGGIVVNYHDVTIREALEKELRHQAFHDSLTGLANRALFGDRLEHALARASRTRRQLATIFLDLDDFKTVNDSLGHGEGDRLLIEVSRRLETTLRAEDTIARLGGDEFAVLIEDPSDASAPAEVGQRLLAALEAPFAVAGASLVIRASAGVATAHGRRPTAEELLRNADTAMYTAKRNGKNRVETFQQGMHAAAVARLALNADLEGALERNEFSLVYQPIVDLATAAITGAEALLRWQHPRRGLLAPDEFIGALEESGLIVPVGRWVLTEACDQAAAWHAQFGSRLTMSVNVSGRQIQDGTIVEDVRAAVRRSGVTAESLLLEFTESIVMHQTDATAAVLADLKALGVRLAIDDFGTGYSSLSYLSGFPVDVLKIDRSFVANLGEAQEQQGVVRSIVSLGRTLHLQTIAEGIEEPGQLAALRQLGADEGQGYFFARPMTREAMGEVLASTARLLGEPAQRPPTAHSTAA